jgi:hypothetical protein
MKRLSCILMAIAGLAWASVGCGNASKTDTSKLEQSFAGTSSQSDVTQAATAIQTGDFATAVTVLKKVIKAGGLTQAQKDGIASAVVGMQTTASQDPKKYRAEMYHSISSLIDHLEGREPVAR